MNGDDRGLTRRAYLRTAGTAGAVAALAGCGRRDAGTTETSTRGETATTPAETTGRPPGTDTTTAAPTTLADRFDTAVNVADAGADDTGEDPINDVVDEHLGDDTLLYFPPGRYRLHQWEVLEHSNLGVVGRDATLVPRDGNQVYWLKLGDLEEFLFQGFTLDCTAAGTGPANHISVTGGTNVVRDVALRGHRTVPRSGFEIAATGPDSELLFENVRLPDGSTGGNGVYVFPESVGTLTFRDCRIEHWAEGLYASYQSGPLRVLGGYYANNGIDQVRVGGGHEGALVRGVTVRVDDPRRAKHKPNMRGIWMEEGERVRIENCDVAITDLTGTYSSGAVVVGTQFGAATVENTTIRTDENAYGILVRDPVDSLDGQTMPSMDRLPGDWRVACRNVHVSGSATDRTAVRVARRDACTFENVCIHHPQGSRNGVEVSQANECAIRDSTIDVSGRPILTESASVRTDGIRTDGSCQT